MTGDSVLSRLRMFRWQRLTMAVFALPAILIGVIAMHVLSNDGMAESAAAHATGSGPMIASGPVHGADEGIASAQGPGLPAPAEGCEGLCGPGHAMLGMICVLALLVTSVLLTLRLMLVRCADVRRMVRSLAANAAALAPPTPPSLHVLSISRT